MQPLSKFSCGARDHTTALAYSRENDLKRRHNDSERWTAIDPKNARRAGFASNELIQKTIRAQRATDHNISHVSGSYRCNPMQLGSPTRARTWDLRINRPS